MDGNPTTLEPVGREFESLRAHQFLSDLQAHFTGLKGTHAIKTGYNMLLAGGGTPNPVR